MSCVNASVTLTLLYPFQIRMQHNIEIYTNLTCLILVRVSCLICHHKWAVPSSVPLECERVMHVMFANNSMLAHNFINVHATVLWFVFFFFLWVSQFVTWPKTFDLLLINWRIHESNKDGVSMKPFAEFVRGRSNWNSGTNLYAFISISVRYWLKRIDRQVCDNISRRCQLHMNQWTTDRPTVSGRSNRPTARTNERTKKWVFSVT